MQQQNTVNCLTALVKQEIEDEGLPPELAAIWGAFLHEGLMDSRLSSKRENQVLGLWKMGCIELMTEVCKYLPDVWEATYSEWNADEFYCGVFEYEVISPLGKYLGDYIVHKKGQFPPEEVVKAVIRQLIADYLIDSTVPKNH